MGPILKQYITLQCSVCTRVRDDLVDVAHYTPDKCTITLGCEGRLQPRASANSRKNKIGVPPIGVTNWAKRGSKQFERTSLEEDRLLNLSTGIHQQIVIAVPEISAHYFPPGAPLSVYFIAEQQTLKDYRQYTFRRQNLFSIVNGVEDNQAKKVLRYVVTDSIQVFVNGVKRNEGVGVDEYQLYDGVNSVVPPNSVLFNSPIAGGSTQVDVVITSAPEESNRTITFYRSEDDESRKLSGAWEGVGRISDVVTGKNYWLFVQDFSENTALDLDVKLRIDASKPARVSLSQGDFIVSDVMILLSREKAFTAIDRNLSKWIKVSDLNSDTNYLVVKKVDGQRALFCTESACSNVFPPMLVRRFNDHELVKKNLTGNRDASELDSSLISGPDA